MANKDLPVELQQEIVEKFKTDPNAFSEVYDFYYEQILKYLIKRTGSAETAYDLTAETFLKAFKNFHKFKWQGYSIKVWVYRIATNSLKDHYRKKTVTPILPEDLEGHDDLVEDVKDELQALDKALFGDEEVIELKEAIDSLNPKYQNIISLYYFSGLSQAEIGETINRSESAVKAMMHRAMTQLREKLKSHG